MTNRFEKAYKEFKEIQEAYSAAEKEKSESGMTKAKADYQTWKKSCEGEGKIFEAIYREYRESRENGNECLNFSGDISKAEEYTTCLKMNGITKFTFSSGWSGAIGNALELQKNGFRMTGLTEVKGREDAWTGERETLAALVFEIA